MAKTLAYMLCLEQGSLLVGILVFTHHPIRPVVLGLIFGANIFQGSLVPTKPFYCERFSCCGIIMWYHFFMILNSSCFEELPHTAT